MNKLKWGILGPGRIAIQFAKGLQESETGELFAVGSRSWERAEAFIKEQGGERAYGSYPELLQDRDVEAVYIATPHPQHVEWAIRAAQAGKHILCEKPIGINLGETDAIFEAAEVHGVFAMEAFMYRCYPQTALIYQWIREGKIGDVQLIEASFGFRTNFNAHSRLFANDLAGGGILDVGCYPVSASRMIAGAAADKPFLDPVEVKGSALLGETGVDEGATLTLKFPNGILAQCSTGVRLRCFNQIRVTGTEGVLLVEKPWFGGGEIRVESMEGETLESQKDLPTGYRFEIDAFGTKVAEHRGEDLQNYPELPQTWMSPEDTFGNMKTLDLWRKSIDLVYEMEEPGGVALAPHPDRKTEGIGEGPIERIKIEGFDKPLSSVALGIDNQIHLPFLRTMVDAFVDQGGNVLDTAFIYGGGALETLLGGYLKSRPDLVDKLFIISKGAHLPFCYPDIVEAQLNVSLERLGLDQVDLYMLHRDNTDLPVERFVDALHREQQRGRILKYGVSNWTLERIKEFNEVADAKGVDRIAAVSNNLSLAEMIEPIWPDCESAKDPDFSSWLESTKTLLMPWSSQARGFFTDRSGPDKKEDEDLVRCFYSDANFERKARAEALAEERGVSPLNIALAWVLARPYPVCPLIGPRRLRELRTSLPGLALILSQEEADWLDLDSDKSPFA